MNEREWADLTGASAAWRRRAEGLGDLEAVFDDAGRMGLRWLERGRPRRAWLDGKSADEGAVSRAPGLSIPVPELEALFRDFDALHPVAETLTGPERLELRLKTPVPWPFFALRDAAKPFAARPAYWAVRLGARGVSALALAGGRMEIFVV